MENELSTLIKNCLVWNWNGSIDTGEYQVLDESESIKNLLAAYEKAIKDERERCAKLADVLANPDALRLPPDGRIAAEIIAVSIRSHSLK